MRRKHTLCLAFYHTIYACFITSTTRFVYRAEDDIARDVERADIAPRHAKDDDDSADERDERAIIRDIYAALSRMTTMPSRTLSRRHAHAAMRTTTFTRMTPTRKDIICCFATSVYAIVAINYSSSFIITRSSITPLIRHAPCFTLSPRATRFILSSPRSPHCC